LGDGLGFNYLNIDQLLRGLDYPLHEIRWRRGGKRRG